MSRSTLITAALLVVLSSLAAPASAYVYSANAAGFRDHEIDAT